ncbi:MAG: hypothetical protein CMO01_00195 [Thalassobius sp.]|nr:hypothetical protein [Thalassovita sp.]
MNLIKKSTLSGLNQWLAELRRSKDALRFSLVQFDSHGGPTPAAQSAHAPAGAVPAGQALGGPLPGFRSEMELLRTHVATPIAEVPDMTDADFLPRGGTPLIDAAVTTIHAIEESLEGRTDVKVVLAIQTDGQENTSKSHSWADLKALVAEKEAIGWEILFMGAGIDAYDQGAKMGIAREKTISYGTDMAQTVSAFRDTGSKTVLYSSGTAASMAYTSEEKLRAGDAG